MKTQDNRDRISAIYVRLSEEDHDKVHETDDSLSIQNQNQCFLNSHRNMDGLSMTSITMTTMPVQTDLAQSSTG